MNNRAHHTRQWPFHLLLFPAFFVLHGFVENLGFVSLKGALLLWVTYVIAAFAITALFYLPLRDTRKAATIATIILAFHFFFGNVRDALVSLAGNGFITRYMFLVPLAAILIVAAVIVARRNRTPARLTLFLNILFAVLLAIDLFQLFRGKREAISGDGYRYASCDTCSNPDVYVIVLDEYAGEQQLRDLFGVDNTPFFDSLAARGFQTLRNTTSNYNYTPYSTAATLQMQYLDSSVSHDGKKGYRHAINTINQNNLTRFFRDRGYQFFNHSPFTFAGKPAPVKGSFVPVDTKLITAGTFLTRFEKDVFVNLANKYNFDWYIRKKAYVTRDDNAHIVQLASNMSANTGTPKFVYTHLLMPHFPYYYNEQGQPLSYAGLRKSALENTSQYLSYLKYTNREILKLLDSILQNSPRPPIIALLSDHGYRHFPGADVKYYFSNLLSVHLPQKHGSKLQDSTSNVNLFRMILNSEFGQQLPLLDNRTILVDF